MRHYAGCTGLKTGFKSHGDVLFWPPPPRARWRGVYCGHPPRRNEPARFDAARTLPDHAFANYTLVMPETGAPDVPVSLGKAASVPVLRELRYGAHRKGTTEGAFRRLRAAGEGGRACCRRQLRYAPVRCRKRNDSERSDQRGGERGARRRRGAGVRPPRRCAAGQIRNSSSCKVSAGECYNVAKGRN